MNLLVSRQTRPLSGRVKVPGDKSIGHRAVIFGALASGHSNVFGLSGGEDNLRTVSALRSLGVHIRPIESGIQIDGVGIAGFKPARSEIDCGNSGTTIRLLSGLLAPCGFATVLDGDQYLRRRPMGRIGKPLEQMGATIAGAAGKKPGEIYAPLTITGGNLHGITYISEVASAQVKTAILLAALAADGETSITEPLRSRDHSERMLSALGAPLQVDGTTVRVRPASWDRKLARFELRVPGDFSSAAFLLAAATLVEGSDVTVEAVGINPTRTGFVDVLEKMGANISVENRRDENGEPIADLRARAAPLSSIDIAGELSLRAIDELPLIAAVAACANGDIRIRDAAELRVKESDRVAATATMLRSFGAECEEHDDGLTIHGGTPLVAGVVPSHGDHRIAMAGAILALRAEGNSTIEDTANIATSFPNFVELLRTLGASLQSS